MPNDIDQHRAKVGKYTSETQTPFGLGRNQRVLNELAASMGQRPTREGLKTFNGYLYVYSILSALAMPEPTPNQSKNTQKSSRSTHRRQETPANTTRHLHSEKLPHNQFVTLTDAARQWSLEIHQLAQGISTFSDHLPEKTTEYQSEQGVGKKKRKRSSFRNIRQTAITESQKLNDDRSDGTSQVAPSSSKHPNKSISFSGKDAADNLIKTFQASFEETQKQSGMAQEETIQPIEKAFWEDLATTFYNFFSRFEHTPYKDKQAEVSRSPVMDHFINLMERTFSADPTPINQERTQKSGSVLKQEEVPFSGQLWQLTSELGTLFSGFVQSLDVIQHLGAEAVPISEKQYTTPDKNVPTSVPVSDGAIEQRGNQLESTTLSTIDLETEQVHYINETIVTDQLPAIRYQEPLPVFFYDRALFQRKNETSHVNKKLKEFFVKEKMANDTTPDSELPEIAEKWMGDKDLDKLGQLERKHFLAYTLLKNYGMENVRWGEFISASKLQDIFLQWKTNTWLEDYTYKEITEKTSQYDLSETEPVLVTSFNEYQKESKQLFSEFINDLPRTIPKTEEISPIYYSEELFEAREKTEKVNEEVWSHLVNQDFVKDIQTRRELVQKLQGWILSGGNYETILERQRQAAEVICQEYGITVLNMTPIEARLYLLQWENNNAQAGYSFRRSSEHENQEVGENTTNKAVETVFIEQEIAAFLQENDIEVPLSNKKLLPELDENQKEKQREKIASFLTGQGIACENHEPQQLIKGITRWFFLEGSTTEPATSASTALEEITTEPNTSDSAELEETVSETSYVVKFKQLANIILGKKEEESISEEEASGIVTRWIIEQESDRRSSTALPDTSRAKRSLATQTSAQKDDLWQSPKLMSRVEHFFQEQGVLSENPTKEKRLIAMAKWLLHQEDAVLRTDRMHMFAQVILNELNLYGGKHEEKISDKDAETTVMKWLFENVLGCSLEEHIARTMVTTPDPSKLAVNQLKAQLEYSPYEAGLSFDHLPLKEKIGAFTFKKLWEAALEQTLPSLFQSDDNNSKKLISDQKLLMRLTGTKLLEREEYRTKISESEKEFLGAAFLDSVVEKKELSFEELQAIFMPALLVTAQLEPERLREALIKGTYKEVALSTFISYWQKGYFKLVEKQETIDDLFQAYQEATLKWRRKQMLAEETVRECYKSNAPIKGNPPPLLVYYGALSVTKTDAIARYISGGHPCPTAHWEVPNLDEWYKESTGKVADAYSRLDTKLIELALESMDPDESQFLFSAETQIYEASAKIKRTNFKRIPIIGLGGDIQYKLEPIYTDVNLKKTELFVGKCGDEERVYGLKKLENEGGYVVYRVDQDPSLYVKYQLFEINRYEPPYDTFSLNMTPNSDRFKYMDSQSIEEGKSSVFALRFSDKHRRELYDKLYQTGDEKTPTEKVLDALTHVIPFYDCVTGIIEKDVGKAVPSCLIDVVLLIPVVGEAVALSTKFGLGVARAIARGGIRSALRNSGHFLPTSAELGNLGISMARYLDPGFELVADGSKLMTQGLTKLSTKVQSKEAKTLLGKLEKLEKETPIVPESIVMAHLPRNGPEIPVKRVSDHLYVRVTNLQTGDTFGDYYLLKNNQLEVFKGPISFSEEQKRLIDIVAIKIKDNQKVIDEKNLNPAAYGEGRVRTVLEEGKPDQFLIKMNDQWVSVRETPIEGHGVRYDAKIGEELFPVNFNGMEWYFEAKTSPFMAEEVRTSIGKQLEKFETRQDPMSLSAPDERGLIRDVSGRTYIKIEDHYVPLILLDKEAGRYHLVKKNVNEPMTILRFHPETGQFHVETPLEKKLWQE
ncbi:MULTISPECIES: QWxxN domain [unclassified Enterococcus]|uniref:QWxxN domain n=1 Tax=unclassified Enterococcus TaxID=2608891 RepID=UPI0013E9D474|nr:MULTISPECIES: QWxxN domain [unclassified Enterococcus]